MQVERTASSRGHRVWLVARAIALSLVVSVAFAVANPLAAQTLERIKESGRLSLGYLADARPFTHGTGTGAPEGYSAQLCKVIAEQAKTQLALSNLAVDWVAVSTDAPLREVRGGSVDILCTPLSATLTRRRDVSFSIPVYPGGVRAVVRADAPVALRDALAESPRTRPVWRGSPAATVLGKSTFAVVAGTTAESTLRDRLVVFQIDAKTVSVPDYRAALQQLHDGKADVVFGDPAVILGVMEGPRDEFVILDRLLSHEPYALALPRSDDDFRLFVDTALTQLYVTNGLQDLYAKTFGAIDDKTRAFFSWSTPTQ